MPDARLSRCRASYEWTPPIACIPARLTRQYTDEFCCIGREMVADGGNLLIRNDGKVRAHCAACGAAGWVGYEEGGWWAKRYGHQRTGDEPV